MGELHIHPRGEVKPQPLLHALLDKKDKVRTLIALVEYEDGQIDIVHSTMTKKDLCYYKDIFVKFVEAKLP